MKDINADFQKQGYLIVNGKVAIKYFQNDLYFDLDE